MSQKYNPANLPSRQKDKGSGKPVYNSRSKPPTGFTLIEAKLNQFKAKMREAEAESTEFKRKTEVLWPILRLTHQRSRYVYQMYLKKIISEDVFEYCSQLNLIDRGLISYWKRPGYEHLCCIDCAQHTTTYGAACVCRVPQNQLSEGVVFECKPCGCRGCSGTKKVSSENTPTPAPTDRTKNDKVDEVKENDEKKE